MWDSSAFVGDWPFRHLADGATERLEARLRREGVERAFVSPLAGLFATDPQPANAAWGAALQDLPFFRFVPVLNPTLPRWERSLHACRERWSAVGVRLHPNYHGYSPTDASVQALMQAAGEAALPVVLQLRMQDMRSMHPAVRVSDVDWQEALALAQLCPQTPLFIGGAKWAEGRRLQEAAADLPHLYLDISHLEYVDGLRRCIDRFGTQRLLFGTHAPLFTPTSARLKVETARLTEAERHALCRGNAEQLWSS